MDGVAFDIEQAQMNQVNHDLRAGAAQARLILQSFCRRPKH